MLSRILSRLPAVPSTLTLEEHYHDRDVLSMVAQLDTSKPFGKAQRDNIAAASAILKRLRGLTSSKIKYSQKSYPLSNGKTIALGRLYPLNSNFHCYQNMLSSMRRAVARELYVELDMQNAHYMICLGLAPELGAFKEYIDNRQDIVSAVTLAAGVDTKAAKLLFIRILYGGHPKCWMRDNNVDENTVLPDIVSKLTRAVDTLKAKLAADDSFNMFEEASKIKIETSGKAFKKWECSALALLLQHIEACCMQSAFDYLRTVHNISPASLIHDGLLIDADKWPDDPLFLEHVSQAVTSRVGFTVRYDSKTLEMHDKHREWLRLVNDNSAECIPDLDDAEVARRLVATVGDKIIMTNDSFFVYDEGQSLWVSGKVHNIMPRLVLQMPQRIFKGLDPVSREPVVKNLGTAKTLAGVERFVPGALKTDNNFLVQKWRSTYQKIKFADGVWFMATGEWRPNFDPQEHFMVEVPRKLPPRNEESIRLVTELIQGIYTPNGQEFEPMRDDFDFSQMPLWQFWVLAAGIAIAGEVEHKLMFAMIGQRDSGKGILMLLFLVAFGSGLVNTGLSANNLLGSESNTDEAKKFMWLRDVTVKGSRVVWTNEIRTLGAKGNTFVDGNLVKGIASGGDPLCTRGNFQDPFLARPEFTMFLNCNDFPVTKPAIGNSVLRIVHPNKFTSSPSRPNHKLADPSLKKRIQDGEFTDGLVWLVLDMYLAFKRSGKVFVPIPSVMEATENAEEGSEENIIDCLSSEIEFSETLRDPEECKRRGLVLKSDELREVLRRLQDRDCIAGRTLECIRMHLNDNGYRSGQIRADGKKLRVNYGARLKDSEDYQMSSDDF